jgi:hypothetical protein
MKATSHVTSNENALSLPLVVSLEVGNGKLEAPYPITKKESPLCLI